MLKLLLAVKLVAFVILVLFAVSLPSHAKSNTSEITFASHVEGGMHRHEIQEALRAFNKRNETLNITLESYRGIDRYSAEIENWLANNSGPDIFWSLGGSRVKQYADVGVLKDLTQIIKRSPHYKNFPKVMMDAVTFNNKLYGIPISTTLVQFYYSQSLFTKFNVDVPSNWQQLLTACNVFHQNNSNLIALGTNTTQWTLHGWFDYLNIRLHGVEYHKEVLSGQRSFLEPKIKLVLSHLKQLKENNCFNRDYHKFTIWDVAPSLLRGYSGMVLLNSLPVELQHADKSDIGVIEFPTINKSIPKYTVSPVSVLVVPSYIESSESLSSALDYLMSSEFQKQYVNIPQYIPASMAASDSDSEITKRIKSTILHSPGGIQYFDRDADIRFSSQTPKVLVDFLDDLDITKAMKKLEALRKSVYLNKRIKK